VVTTGAIGRAKLQSNHHHQYPVCLSILYSVPQIETNK